MFGTLYNTNININGSTVYRSSYNSLGCGCGFGGFSPGCFGFGYCNPYDSFSAGAGIGLGFAAGMMLMPAIPAIFKGIGKGASFLWNKAIAPAGKFVWNSALKPAGKGIGKACSFVWNKGIKPAAQWVGRGIKNAWNWIFGKKNSQTN